MADTDAERQKRKYYHDRDDHSLCRRENCLKAGKKSFAAQVELDESVVPVAPFEYGFGPNASRYWAGMHKAYVITPDIEPILIQACRLINRLDKLDSILSNRDQTWLYIRRMPNLDADDEVVFKVIMNSALRDERDESTALRGLVSELRAKLGIKDSGEKAKVKATNSIGGLKDEIAAKRLEKQM
jgi:hypothetical protein